MTVFIDGYGGDVQTYDDTFLDVDNPDSNNAGNTMGWGSWTADGYRSLIRFNWSSIPSNAIISEVKFSYYPYYVYGSCSNFVVKRILSANNGWTRAGATWNHAVDNTVEWAGGPNGCGVSGTDYAAANLYGPATPGMVNGQYNDILLNLTEFANIRNANYGMIFISPTAGCTITYYSSHNANTLTRPKLTITYTLPAAKASKLLLGVGI
jgi:hypothetical protein